MRKWLAILTGNIQDSKEPSPWPKIAPDLPATVNGILGCAALEITKGLDWRGNTGDACQMGWAGRRLERAKKGKSVRLLVSKIPLVECRSLRSRLGRTVLFSSLSLASGLGILIPGFSCRLRRGLARAVRKTRWSIRNQSHSRYSRTGCQPRGRFCHLPRCTFP